MLSYHGARDNMAGLADLAQHFYTDSKLLLGTCDNYKRLVIIFIICIFK